MQLIFKRYFVYFFILIGLCYSNTYQAPWQLDDPPNITNNRPLLIDNLLPKTLYQTLFAKPFAEGNFYRPIANFSFALNWYFGHDNPFGYHLVNLLLHALTAFFLFKSTLLLLQSTHIKNKYTENDALYVALLSATLWAINPIQTQAVTYIVQRMASMAAMFFVFSLYCYIRGRQSDMLQQRLSHFFLCGLFFLLALGCKENVVTLIPSLLLLEWLFFYKNNDRFSRIMLTALVFANILFILAACYYIVKGGYLQGLMSPIGSRPFSLWERLLTQPSILLFYLSLLLYPSPERLSIDHSFPLSTSLWHPWTTLPAILCISGLIIFALWQGRKKPLLSLALLFYFINQLVESTIIPLELFFEHRNYLPSFFLFLPLAAGLQRAINHTSSTSRLIHGALIAFIPILLIVNGLGTYSRNAVWATEESLWTDTLNKAPTNARPFAKLGEIYGWQKEKNLHNLQTSVALLQKSLGLETPRTSFKAAIVGNIGKVYANYGLLDQAIISYRQSLELNPDFINSRFDLAEALTLKGNFDQALDEMNLVIEKNDLQSRFFNLKALILLWLDRPQEAAECSQQAMHKTQVNKERYFYNTGVSLTKTGYYSQGLWFLRRASGLFPDDRRILYSLIENRALAGDPSGAENFTLQLLKQQGISSISIDLEKQHLDYSSVPVDTQIITPFITKNARSAVITLEQIEHQQTKSASQ